MRLVVERMRPEGFGFHERDRLHTYMPDECVVDHPAILWDFVKLPPEIGCKVWLHNLENEQFFLQAPNWVISSTTNPMVSFTNAGCQC